MITKMYSIEGMACENCLTKVRSAFKNRPEVIEVQLLKGTSQAIVSLREMLSIETINSALGKAGHYSASEIVDSSSADEKKSNKNSSLLKLFHRKKPCCR